MMAPQLPLPNDEYQRGIVVASVWVDDDNPEAPIAMLLVMEKEAPFYRVQDVQFFEGQWENLHHTGRRFPNIVPAVEEYKQCGGDH